MQLLPGKWYVENGNICVINDDGTISIFPTSWEEERNQRIIEKVLEKDEKREKLKTHLSNKETERKGQNKIILVLIIFIAYTIVMSNYNFDYITRCEICGELIRFDNPFLTEYDRVCKNKDCIKKFEEKKIKK